jgi:hypothetical protein
VKRPVSEIAAFAATIIVAAAIGFGIPLLWVWIGSQVQGGTGSASNLDFSVAMLILFGIIVSYVIVLYLAGWVMTRFGGEPIEGPQRGSANSPWMRGMTDSRATEPHRPHRAHLRDHHDHRHRRGLDLVLRLRRIAAARAVGRDRADVGREAQPASAGAAAAATLTIDSSLALARPRTTIVSSAS